MNLNHLFAYFQSNHSSAGSLFPEGRNFGHEKMESVEMQVNSRALDEV